jgi:eukaryotic-like serine/threonine-protein kinase
MDAPEDRAPAGVQCRYCGDMHPPSFSHCPKTGRSMNAGRALIGRVIAERYRILALLGEGGMGAVYVAEHLMIGRKVAIKRLHPELTSDDKAVARFQREARAAAATGHEHIVEVLDLGFGEDGAPFLVMEYLRGHSLAEIIRAEERLELRRGCRIVGQVLAALGAVHARGIVHRDLKPDNVLLTQRKGDPDFVKVVDFGISKMQKDEGDQAMALTRTGVMLGTPFYMSPEQARGIKELDHRVDLYGVGVILHECLTGRLPFEGDNYHQLLQAILAGKHAPARELRPDMSEELSAVIDRALAADPAKRYATAREMLLALVPFGAVDPGTTHESDSTHSPVFSEAPTSQADTTPWQPPRPIEEPTTLKVDDAGRGSDPGLKAAARASAPGPSAPAKPRVKTPVPRGRVPEPSLVRGPPRHFIAQSADWEDPTLRADKAALADRSDVSPPPRKDSTSPFRPEESSAARKRVGSNELDTSLAPSKTPQPGEPAKVKGSLLIGALEFLKMRGPDFQAVLTRIDPVLAAQYAGVILPMAWIALHEYVDLLRAAERTLGASDGALTLRVGRATADRELTTTHRLFMQTTTPAMAVERIPQIFRTYHQPGKAKVEPAPAGGYRVTVEGLNPDTLPHALVMSGFYHRMLELAGAQDVRSAVVSCRERGDDATVTTLRWR